MGETKYGVISDIHNGINLLPKAIDLLKDLGVKKLLINGDISNEKERPQDTIWYNEAVLEIIGKSNLESYVQPGSHESLFTYSSVMDYFSDKYSNIIDVTKQQKIEHKGHTLVFLPGSDFLCGGGYLIGNDEGIPSGRYIQTQIGLMSFEEFGQYASAVQQGIAQGAVQYANMNDLRKLVNDPDKSIVVCHVPRKFDNLEDAVDMAEFGEATQKFNLYGNDVEQGSVFPLPVAQQILQTDADFPIEIKRENRGNKDLKSLFEELGINKAVSGHFHESSHRANDSEGNHVDEDEWVKKLFWNSGHFEKGYFGILSVDEDKVKYRNLFLHS